jgi:hypothetical protein
MQGTWLRRYAILVVSVVLAVPAFFTGTALGHNVSSGPTVFRSINTQFGTFCAEQEAWILHPGIFGLVYSTWAKTYDRTGLFCATGYGPPAGQIYVSQSVYQSFQGNSYLCGSSSAYNAASSSEAGVAISPCNFGTATGVSAFSLHAIYWSGSWNPQGNLNISH